MTTRSNRLAQKGFTLIELIITIVIIGVLAAVAIPKFQNLSRDAEQGVAAGVGASLASASSVNYSRAQVPNAIASPNTGFTYYHLANCGDINTNRAALADIPSGYTVGPAATTLVTTGTTVQCTVTSPNGATATFNAYGA